MENEEPLDEVSVEIETIENVDTFSQIDSKCTAVLKNEQSLDEASVETCLEVEDIGEDSDADKCITISEDSRTRTSRNINDRTITKVDTHDVTSPEDEEVAKITESIQISDESGNQDDETIGTIPISDSSCSEDDEVAEITETMTDLTSKTRETSNQEILAFDSNHSDEIILTDDENTDTPKKSESVPYQSNRPDFNTTMSSVSARRSDPQHSRNIHLDVVDNCLASVVSDIDTNAESSIDIQFENEVLCKAQKASSTDLDPVTEVVDVDVQDDQTNAEKDIEYSKDNEIQIECSMMSLKIR
jgi:hypothetical protein